MASDRVDLQSTKYLCCAKYSKRLKSSTSTRFRNAYDSIKKPKLYEALYELNSSPKQIRLVKATMAWVICKIKIQNEMSNAFQTNKGLRQGDAICMSTI